MFATTTTKPFICLHCRSELAQTDGARLILSDRVVYHPIRLECACGAVRRWKPVAEHLATDRHKCYAS